MDGIVRDFVFFRRQIDEMKLTVEGLEKERDFYFGKLRDIEVICQEPRAENVPIVQEILDILYATEVSARYSRSLVFLSVQLGCVQCSLPPLEVCSNLACLAPA